MPAFTRRSATVATASSARRIRKSPRQTRHSKSPARLVSGLRRRQLHRFTAAACTGLVRVVENELRRKLFGLVVHLCPEEEHHAFGVNKQLPALVLDDLVGRIYGVGILHRVFHSRTAAV